MRRVLHLKMVTQCAMLDDFGMLLVLSDKVSWMVSLGIANHNYDFQALFIYHIEALVPSLKAHTLLGLHNKSMAQGMFTSLVLVNKERFPQNTGFLHVLVRHTACALRVVPPI